MRFIRKNGRIIPIRDNREENLKGAGEIGAGAVSGLAGGAGTGVMVRHAQHLAKDAKNDYRIAQSNFRAATGMNIKAASKMNPGLAAKAGKAITKAVNKRANAKMMFRSRNPILHTSAAVSALLIGHGVNRVSAAMNGGQGNGAKSKAAAGVAAAATYGAYYRGLGIKNPLQIAANVIARYKGTSRPFKKYGPGGEI